MPQGRWPLLCLRELDFLGLQQASYSKVFKNGKGRGWWVGLVGDQELSVERQMSSWARFLHKA